MGSKTGEKKIFDEHLKDLELSAISEETAINACLYSLKTQDLVCKFGFPLVSGTTGLIFPYPGNNDFSRVKFFPEIHTKDGTIKYGQKKGSPNHLYIPSSVQKILSDPSKKIGFTEGEKKTLAAMQGGLNCIGAGGLWSWMQDGKPIPDLDLIDLFGRSVDFIPDSDVWSRPDLLQAVYAFCYELQARGADISVIRLPNINGTAKTGLDDFLIKHTVEDLEACERITLSHKGFKSVKKWHDGWLKKNKTGESEQKEQKEQDYTAIHEKLVDLVIIKDGQICFLMLDNGELFPDTKIRKEDGSGDLFPPPSQAIKWSLPRLDEVLKHYKTDSDRQLYNDILSYLKSISELPGEDYYHLLACWVFHTYCFDKAAYSHYLWLYAIPERGKSRTGHGVIYIAYRGLTVESLRDPYLIRVAQNLMSALFIDAMDISKKAEKTGTEDILLQRFERGAVVPRVLYPDRGPHKDTVYFNIYGPTVIATNEKVSEILGTRAIQIIMPESSRQFENDVRPEDALPLRERLVAWRGRHMDNDMPEAKKPCRGRLGDILRPLRQVVLMVAPDQEERFFRLCSEIQNQRYDTLADTLEASIMQAISDLEDQIENCKLLSKTITEKLNEDIPEKFHRAQRTVTQACKRMGFRSIRSCGDTYIEINEILFFQLSERYLRKSALSALNAQHAKNIEESECTCECTCDSEKFKCTNENPSALTKKEVHSVNTRNNYKCSDSADSAVNNSACSENHKNGIEKCFTCPACDKVAGMCYASSYFDGQTGSGVRCVDAVKTCTREIEN
jgi:hypothetical protein